MIQSATRWRLSRILPRLPLRRSGAAHPPANSDESPDALLAAASLPRPDGRLHPLTLSFRRGLEGAYQRDRLEESLPLGRAALLMGALFSIGFFVADRLLGTGYSTSLHYTLTLGIAVPLTAVYLGASFIRRLRSLLPLLGAVTTTAYCASLAVVLIESEHIHRPLPCGLLLLSLTYYFFMTGMLFRIAVPLSLLVLALYTTGTLWLGQVSPLQMLNVYLVLISVTLGIAACRVNEVTHRRAWLQSRQLRELSELDPLTAVLNYRAFFTRAQAALCQAQRSGRSMALLVIDLDHFKQINDRYGHLTGDECLRRTGRLLSRVARRPQDFAGRLGGEEFALLLYNAQADFAGHLAESLRGWIAGLQIDSYEHRGLRVTASIGLACAQAADVEGIETLMARADKAMYRAKEEGRNRVCLA